MHLLILGPTGSGKSTLTQQLVSRIRRSGIKVLVYAKRDIERWQACADFVTADRETFLSILARPGTRGCFVVLDDAGNTVGWKDKELEGTATEGRHDGHTFVYIAQAAAQLNKIVRRNCSKLITFKQSVGDCDILARDFCQPALAQAAGLQRFEYLECETYGQVKKGKVQL